MKISSTQNRVCQSYSVACVGEAKTVRVKPTHTACRIHQLRLV